MRGGGAVVTMLDAGEQVAFVEDQDGGAAAFLAFGYEGRAGLGEQPGSEVGGGLAEGVKDLFVDKPRTPISGLGR